MTLWLPRQDIRFSVTALMHTSVSEPRCGRMSWATLCNSVVSRWLNIFMFVVSSSVCSMRIDINIPRHHAMLCCCSYPHAGQYWSVHHYRMSGLKTTWYNVGQLTCMSCSAVCCISWSGSSRWRFSRSKISPLSTSLRLIWLCSNLYLHRIFFHYQCYVMVCILCDSITTRPLKTISGRK